MRIDDSGFRKRAFNHSLMTRQWILSTGGSEKMHNAKGTPPFTFRQLWDNVESYIVLFHISQFDCFLFARNIRDMSMTPAICQAYHIVVSQSASLQTVQLKLSKAKF